MVDGSIKFINAEDEGCIGDEEQWTYDFVGETGGSYTFNEDDDPTDWNVKLIDKKHPKYNKEIESYGKQMSAMINKISKMF
jgi:hypothetical protein